MFALVWDCFIRNVLTAVALEAAQQIGWADGYGYRRPDYAATWFDGRR